MDVAVNVRCDLRCSCGDGNFMNRCNHTQVFGMDWESALKKGLVYNAKQACEKLGVDGGVRVLHCSCVLHRVRRALLREADCPALPCIGSPQGSSTRVLWGKSRSRNTVRAAWVVNTSFCTSAFIIDASFVVFSLGVRRGVQRTMR